MELLIIIGLILIYLTAGYFIGGRWADRSPRHQTMYTVLAWGGFTAGLVPFIARPVLRMAANAFDKLQVDSRQAGRISGQIYAISTLGSFIGTFLPVLVLIPVVGTTLTFLTFSLFLTLVALIGVWKSSGWKRTLVWI